MADLKISALPASTVPLAGTEVVPLVQSSTTKNVSVANLTAGRAVSVASLSSTGAISATSAAAGAKLNLTNTSSPNGKDWRFLSFTDGVLYVDNGAGTVVVLTSTNLGMTGSITASDNFVVGTSGKGIDFSATPGTGTSELLADYEEGTFTSSITPSTSGTIPGTFFGTYTKVGQQVTVTGEGYVPSSVTSPVGYVTISLPFAIGTTGSGAGKRLAGSIAMNAVASENVADFLIVGFEGASELRIYLGAGTTLANSAAQFQIYTDFKIGCTYFA